jgi:hypothetical protein
MARTTSKNLVMGEDWTPAELELMPIFGLLKHALAQFEKNLKDGEGANDLDACRKAMYDTLEAILGFLEVLNLRSLPAHRLLCALDAIIHGSKIPPEFRLPGIARPDAPAVLAIRGAVAGLAQALFRYGGVKPSGRANEEVAWRLSSDLGRRVSQRRGKITARMISDWRAEYGGRHGQPGLAREAYLRIVNRCADCNAAKLAVPVEAIISEIETAAAYALPLRQKSG